MFTVDSDSQIFYTLFQNKHQPQITSDVEAILMESVETAAKRKNARRLFARSLKGLEKERVLHLPEC